jgi:hypothetical protein
VAFAINFFCSPFLIITSMIVDIVSLTDFLLRDERTF